MHERWAKTLLLTKRSRTIFVNILLLIILCLLTQLASSSKLVNQTVSQSESETNLLEVGHASQLLPAPQKSVELKVVSYNMRWRGGDELRQLINSLKDDEEIGGAAIIGLQEVDRNKKRTQNVNTVKLIAEELGSYYAWTAPPSTKGDKEEETGVAILSYHPLSEVRRILLPHEGPGRRRRVAIGATVVVAKARVRVYSIHSENRIPVAKKIDQMNAVLEDLGKYDANMRAIVMGDLNTWEPAAIKRTHELFTRANFKTPFDNDTPTFVRNIVLFPIKLKLDWIWLRSLETSGYGIDKTVDLSDHWPLWAIVSPPGGVEKAGETRR